MVSEEANDEEDHNDCEESISTEKVFDRFLFANAEDSESFGLCEAVLAW